MRLLRYNRNLLEVVGEPFVVLHPVVGRMRGHLPGRWIGELCKDIEAVEGLLCATRYIHSKLRGLLPTP